MSARQDPSDRSGDPYVSHAKAAQWRPERTRVLETLGFKVVALVLTSTLAILLWQFAIASIGYGASVVQAADRSTQAVIQECPRGLGVPDSCTVRLTGTGWSQVSELSHPGLFALNPGDVVTVTRHDDGSVGMAGWQPLADAGLLALLAIAVTGYAIGWWRRVLEHSNPRYDGGDPMEEHTFEQDLRRD